MFLAHHGGGGGVVAEEQLAVLAGAAAGAVPPGGFGVGAVAGAARRRAGEGFHVGPVHGQRGAGVLVLVGDAGFQQVIADRGRGSSEGAPSGTSLASASGDQAEGALGLPVGELVRAGLPVFGHAEPGLVVCGQGGQRVADAGQVRGPVVGLGEQHPGQQGADAQLAVPHPGRQQRLDPRRDAGGVDDVLQRGQRDAHRCRPEQRDRGGLIGRVQGGEQVAEPLGAGDPGGVHEAWPGRAAARSRPARSTRSRLVSSRGSPVPPASDRVSGVVMFLRPGSVPPVTRPVPANARRRPAAAGGSGPVPALPAAGRRGHRRAPRRSGRSTSLPRTPRRSGAVSPAPAPRQTSPAARIRRASGGLRVSQRQVAGDLGRAVGSLGPLPGQRRIGRGQRRDHPPGQEPQVGAQRAARRRRTAPARTRRTARSPTGAAAPPGPAPGPAGPSNAASRAAAHSRFLARARPAGAGPRSHRPGEQAAAAATPTTAARPRYSRRLGSAPSPPGGTAKPVTLYIYSRTCPGHGPMPP